MRRTGVVFLVGLALAAGGTPVAAPGGRGLPGGPGAGGGRHAGGLAARESLLLLRGLRDPAVHRHRHRVEHPGRLRGLRELRHPGVLRPRGVFFSIATLALSIVLQTVIINWEFVGGSRGLSVIRPSGPPYGNYVTFL